MESTQLKSKVGTHSRGDSKEHTMTPVEAESNNVNAKTVQLVKLLTEVGPDVPEISRRLGQFKESVRYRYKEKILNKGFAVQAAVDYDKIGLKRMIMKLEFADAYRDYAHSILAAMNELCYVVSFAKVHVQDQYVVNLSAPEDVVNELKDFFFVMKEKGMFNRLDILEFDWFRNSPMMAEFYDFDTGRWDFDWSESGPQTYEATRYMPSKQAKFDYVDLLIIKELQIDANKSLKEIADDLRLNYKKLAWHYATHVSSRKLFRGYTVNWMGTTYDYTIEKALHRKHRYLFIDLFVRDISEIESMTLRQKIDKLPFLWAEAWGDNYFGEFAFPLDYIVEGLEYLGDALSNVKDRAELYTIDQTSAARFTIPYKLFDPEKKKWVFDTPNLVTRFNGLLVAIKGGTG